MPRNTEDDPNDVERAALFPRYDIRGMGGWIGAQQGLQQIVADRALQAATDRKHSQEDFTNYLNMRKQLGDDDKLTQQAYEFGENAPTRAADVRYKGAQADDLIGKPEAATLAHQRAIVLAIKEGDIKTAVEHAHAIDTLNEQNVKDKAAMERETAGNLSAQTVAGINHKNDGLGGAGGSGYAGRMVDANNRAWIIHKDGTASPITTGEDGDQFTAPTANMRDQTYNRGRAVPILERVSRLSEDINALDGVIAAAAGPAEKAASRVNLNNKLAVYDGLVKGFIPIVARALGHSGVLTQQDVDSVREMFPKAGDSKDLRDMKIAALGQLFEDTGVQGAQEAMRNPRDMPGVTGPADAIPGWASSALATEPDGTEVDGGGQTFVKRNGRVVPKK